MSTIEVIEPDSVFITTSTRYPNWGEEDSIANDRSNQLRGNLALEMIKESRNKGFPVTIVDGGSGENFVEKAKKTGADVYEQENPGMSPGRREAFRISSSNNKCKYVCWLEPEKVSIVKDCLPKAIYPIAEEKTDIVVPKRDKVSFSTYPDYQVAYEKKANRMWNKLLRKHGLLTENAEDLDVWFGPKFFRNDKTVVEFFLSQYEFMKGIPKFLENVRPEDWANATFLAIPAALKAGYKVQSVTVPYRHPAQQTNLEKDNIEFRKKRQYQLKSIIAVTSEFLKLSSNKNSYLKRVF